MKKEGRRERNQNRSRERKEKNMKNQKDTRERNQNQVSEIDKLPFDIIFEILSRLPIRSVLQCRRVSKSWRRISRSPEFATAHLSQSTHTSPSIILWKNELTLDPIKCYLVEGDEYNTCRAITWINTWMDKRNITDDFEILGSCNGLICMYESYPSIQVYLFNPFTEKYLALSQSTQTLSLLTQIPCLSSYSPVLGFGFDSNTRTYKVVTIWETYGDGGTMVEVYTLGTGYWRNKGSVSVPYRLCRQEFNIYVNGAIHWTSIEDGGENNSPHYHKFIVSFDLGDEELHLIPAPDCKPANYFGESTSMGVTKGCLSISYYSHRGFMDIWLMKEYGVKESWSKDYIIEVGLPAPVNSLSAFIPLGIDKNGEPLFWHQMRNEVATYNEENQMFRYCEIHENPSFPLACTHVGSLVTLESACGGKKMRKMERKNIKKKDKEKFTRSRRGNMYRQ